MSRIHPDKNFFSGDDSDSSEVHLGRMLQILREFSTDQILSTYVIDDVWEYMDAMKVWCSLLVNCWSISGLIFHIQTPGPTNLKIQGQAFYVSCPSLT